MVVRPARTAASACVVARAGPLRLHGRVDLEQRIELVASTWTPRQQLHPGNVAWHGTRCDGTAPADLTWAGAGWFAEGWTVEPAGPTEVYAHFSPQLDGTERLRAWRQVRAAAPEGRITLASRSDMAGTLRESGAQEAPGPHFLMQHRPLPAATAAHIPAGYRIVPAVTAGAAARVSVHRSAWAPARIKRLLGVPVTGDEPSSGFDHGKYEALRGVGIYRPELDLVAVAADGAPAAFALGWYDSPSRSVLIEPVGTSPEHARQGLSRAVCLALLRAAADLGATQAVVGPRGDDAYPLPRRLYRSLGFTTIDRTQTFTWTTTTRH